MDTFLSRSPAAAQARLHSTVPLALISPAFRSKTLEGKTLEKWESAPDDSPSRTSVASCALPRSSGASTVAALQVASGTSRPAPTDAGAGSELLNR